MLVHISVSLSTCSFLYRLFFGGGGWVRIVAEKALVRMMVLLLCIFLGFGIPICQGSGLGVRGFGFVV